MAKTDSKPIIAIDLDDVLAANAAGFVAFSNLRWGTNLRPEDYSERWEDLWQADVEETERRSLEFHASGVSLRYEHDRDAVHVLQHLAKTYTLMIVTSRRRLVEPETRAWLEQHYAGIFDEVHFAGIYDDGVRETTHMETKGDIFRSLQVSYVIDDQPKHCIAAVEHGAHAVLFGLYPWNKDQQIPEGVTHCYDWLAVGEYFDGIQ
jgi:phosphoglycolate phosphatase-like HAD superfamily hydrolase